jgi:hypothetical protein
VKWPPAWELLETKAVGREPPSREPDIVTNLYQATIKEDTSGWKRLSVIL